MTGKAPRIDNPRVILRLTVNDLLRQEPAMAAPFTQTCAQTNDAECVSFSGDWANKRCAINGVGNGPVYYFANTCFHQYWHPLKRTFKDIGDAI